MSFTRPDDTVQKAIASVSSSDQLTKDLPSSKEARDAELEKRMSVLQETLAKRLIAAAKEVVECGSVLSKLSDVEGALLYSEYQQLKESEYAINMVSCAYDSDRDGGGSPPYPETEEGQIERLSKFELHTNRYVADKDQLLKKFVAYKQAQAERVPQQDVQIQMLTKECTSLRETQSALQAKVVVLEAALSALQKEMAVLRGRQSQPKPTAESNSPRMFL